MNRVKLALSRYRGLVLLVGLVLSFVLDKQMAMEVSQQENAPIRDLAYQLTDIALGLYWIAGSAALILLTSLAIQLIRNESLKEFLRNLRLWASHLFLALLSTGVIVLILKFIVGRERPTHWKEHFHYLTLSPFNFDSLYQSFPSGHTQVIFCVCTMLAALWPRHRLSWLAVAFVIAFTRVLTMKHFVSDVYGGMLVGTLGTQFSIYFWSHWIKRPRALVDAKPI